MHPYGIAYRRAHGVFTCGLHSRYPFEVRYVAFHQQPGVNYIQVLEKVDFPCTVNT